MSLLLLNNLEVILFAGLVGWAIAVRTNRPIPQRLMPIATLGIMAPAISRWPLQFLLARPIWIRCFFAEVFSVLVCDQVTRHKPYWQTVVATPAIPGLMPLAFGLRGTSGMGRLLGWVLHGLARLRVCGPPADVFLVYYRRAEWS
jgi:hypothetical protein